MQDTVKEMKLQDLKIKTPTELLSFAEEVGVENASSMRKQEQMFAILKQLAGQNTEIIGTGVVMLLGTGFEIDPQAVCSGSPQHFHAVRPTSQRSDASISLLWDY